MIRSILGSYAKDIPTLEREVSGETWSKVNSAARFHIFLMTAQTVVLLTNCAIIFATQSSDGSDSFAIVWGLCAMANLYFVYEGVVRECVYMIWTPVITHALVVMYMVKTFSSIRLIIQHSYKQSEALLA